MLQYFYDNDLIHFCDRAVTWEEAIRESCHILKEKKYISQQYEEEIINCIKQYGPYIVLVPGVAMPHSSEDSQGVFGTGISFTKMKHKISFEAGNPDKDAQLFFTLAAKNPEEHMANIASLSEMLLTEGLIEDLLTITNLEDYRKIMKKYSD